MCMDVCVPVEWWWVWTSGHAGLSQRSSLRQRWSLLLQPPVVWRDRASWRTCRLLYDPRYQSVQKHTHTHTQSQLWLKSCPVDPILFIDCLITQSLPSPLLWRSVWVFLGRGPVPLCSERCSRGTPRYPPSAIQVGASYPPPPRGPVNTKCSISDQENFLSNSLALLGFQHNWFVHHSACAESLGAAKHLCHLWDTLDAPNKGVR